MEQLEMAPKKARIVAALFCIAYILIQCFQGYVYSTIPEPANVIEVFLQGAMPIHQLRSLLLLLSFFSLIYVFIVTVFYDLRRQKLLYTVAIIGLLIFCFLEIGIRSIEYFYFQIQLPAAYIQTTSTVAKESIIEKYTVFQSVQAALYFPLMLSQAIGSILIAIIFPVAPKLNLLIKTAFALNTFRLIGRLLGMIANIHWFDSFSGTLYLPFVVVIFGLISIWLFCIQEPEQIPPA